MIYALLLPPQGLHASFARAAEPDRLLPAPLVEGIPIEELLSVRVEVPGAGVIFRSSDGFPDQYVGTELLGGDAGRLRASVGLRPAAADELAIGGLPRSRLPALLGLLGMAIGLLVVAFIQLRREHEMAAMRANFVSSVSHELRTPLALQRVFIDTLKLGRAASDSRRRWALDAIDRETGRLTNLVENVLRFTRGNNGEADFQPIDTLLAAEIADIVSDLRLLAAPAETTLVFRSVNDSVVAPVDRDGLRQILRNLVENAIKYGPRGQRVSVGLDLDGDRALVTVTDEGPGIDPRELAEIWDPFWRGVEAQVSATGGSGIGLSVVREIVERHGGSVDVTNSPSGGAVFTTEFPGARAGSAEPTRLSAARV